ncbi:hypothetical protein HN954_04435 [bacterium]|jgi:sugar-specific transcriptional regulator TrmB|nr:hypothetical protein [bacterium]MBT6831951.1 hypothetical protein [bacterium]MBT6996647.1 hypothetical protein [bacterium]MBT7773067.1 hypothetical protein [bacterium]
MTASSSYLPIRKALRSLGFSDGEVKVLNFLFFKKKATSREISKNTTISFSTVQYLLSNLSIRGLVHCVQEKNDEFEICSEKELYTWIEEQKKNTEFVYDEARETIQDFLQNVQKSSWKPDVTYYEGVEGVKDLYRDMLSTANKSDKKIYSWLDISKIQNCLGDFLYEYIDKRIELGIKSHDIVPKNTMNLQHEKKEENREIHFVENLPIDGEIRIFDEQVAVITFHEEKPVGFVLHGGSVAVIFRAIFQNAWNH